MKISREKLEELYIDGKMSVSKISILCGCSQNKINYWLKKYNISKRSIADAVYLIKNPDGDPFLFRKPRTTQEHILFGLGLGIYWGEGLKRGNCGLRLTNTDIKMMSRFIDFLVTFFKIKKDKLRFSLQVFADINKEEALNYWMKGLDVKRGQFYKTITSEVRGKGTYKYKSQYGVLILYFNNIKLKKIILEMIEKM
jgi:hypothetical protein